MHSIHNALLWFVELFIIQTCVAQIDANKTTCNSVVGTSHKLYEKWDDGVFWRQCVPQGKCVQPQIMGCVTQERNYVTNGEEFEKDGFLYTCVVQPDGWVKHQIVGCITGDGQAIRAGGTYIDGTGEITFRRGCLKTDSNGLEQPVLSCKYSGPKITTEIKVGCYAAIEDGQYFACWKPDPKTGDVETSFTPNHSDLTILRTDGDCIY